MVEAGKLPPSGGRFTCRICGEKLEIRTELLAPQPAAVESRGEVCCPRCGNRFLPQQTAEGDFSKAVDSRRQETGRSREAGGQMKTPPSGTDLRSAASQLPEGANEATAIEPSSLAACQPAG